MHKTLFLIFCLAILATSAFASENETLYGTVTDEDGMSLPGAIVEVRGINESLTKEVVTGAGGQYLISDIPPARYELVVSFKGFETSIQSVTVLVGRSLEVNIQLKVVPLSEGGGPLIINQ